MRHIYNSNSQLIQLLEQIINEGIKIKDNFWENVITQASGAFFGALFAFLFGLLTFWMQKKRERFILHKNAVVALEYLLNEHLNGVVKNSYLIEHDINILKRGHFTYDRLYQLRLPLDLELKLGDLEVINRYFSYKDSVIRVNSDFSKINGALDNINNAAIIRGVDFVHKDNFIHIVQQMEIINKLLSLLTKEQKNLLAFIRIYIRRINSFKEKGLNIFKLDGYTPITKAEIDAELKVLNKEIEKTMKESRENIKKALE